MTFVVDSTDEEKASMGLFPAKVLALSWMTGWFFALVVSEHSTLSFNQMMAYIYGGLAALTVLLSWEHVSYKKNVKRVNELMHR